MHHARKVLRVHDVPVFRTSDSGPIGLFLESHDTAECATEEPFPRLLQRAAYYQSMKSF